MDQGVPWMPSPWVGVSKNGPVLQRVGVGGLVRSQVLCSSHNCQDQDPDLRAFPGPYNNQDDPRKTWQLCSSPRPPECLWEAGRGHRGRV